MERKRTRGWWWRLFLIKIPAAFIVLTALWVLVLKWCPVLFTPLMVQRSVEFRNDHTFKSHHKWVPYGKISPELTRAVIASEDNLFDSHDGFDRKAIRQAREEVRTGQRKRMRGASTISQQTAKNVFLLPGRSYLRKGLEAWFTVLIERIWGKERIMEVYLNVIETGKGVYGAESTAEVFFGTDASSLGRRQCCLIAACLPNPLKRSVSKPSSYVSSRATQIANLESKLSYPAWIYHNSKTTQK